MKALSILAMALCLMASTVSSHAEVISFNGSPSSYREFISGYANDYDFYAALGNLSSPLSVSNNAAIANLEYRPAYLDGQNTFGLSTKNNAYFFNGISFSASTNAPETYLLIYTFRTFTSGDPSYINVNGYVRNGNYIFIRLDDSISISKTVIFPSSTVVALFRTIDGNADLVRASLRFTSLDVTRVSPVPEPNTALMMMSGIGIMGFAARRRRKKLIA